MWALTNRWYAGRLDRDFRRKTPDEYQRLLMLRRKAMIASMERKMEDAIWGVPT